MSDHFLRLVPTDPHWRPTAEAAERSVRLLAEMLPAAESVGVSEEDGVVFFDAGQNTESVACPACGEDLDTWWEEAMDKASASGFSDLAIVTPCCGAETTLNDLTYDWPAAFGVFALEVANSGVPVFTDQQRIAVERTLGSSVKVVWQHL